MVYSPTPSGYLGMLRNHFSTLGVNGINEMVRNFSADAHDITNAWSLFDSLILKKAIEPQRTRRNAKEREGKHKDWGILATTR